VSVIAADGDRERTIAAYTLEHAGSFERPARP
jgi:hypothetical protein